MQTNKQNHHTTTSPKSPHSQTTGEKNNIIGKIEYATNTLHTFSALWAQLKHKPELNPQGLKNPKLKKY